MWLAVRIGWLDRQEREASACFNERLVSCGASFGYPVTSIGPIRRRPRLGGLLNYYERAA
jgi:hypothetical protein